MIPGEYILGEGDISCNVNRKTLSVVVTNAGDRPCQIGSHTHFFEVNKALDFPREKAFGYRLNIPAGTSIRFEPGDTKEVELCQIGGSRTIYGFNALTMGNANSMRVKTLALIRASRQGFRGAPPELDPQEEYKLQKVETIDVDRNDAASIRQASNYLDTIYREIRGMENRGNTADIMKVVSNKQFENIIKLIAIAKSPRNRQVEDYVSDLRKGEYVLHMLENAAEQKIIKDHGEEDVSNDTNAWERYLGKGLLEKSKRIWI